MRCRKCRNSSDRSQDRRRHGRTVCHPRTEDHHWIRRRNRDSPLSPLQPQRSSTRARNGCAQPGGASSDVARTSHSEPIAATVAQQTHTQTVCPRSRAFVAATRARRQQKTRRTNETARNGSSAAQPSQQAFARAEKTRSSPCAKRGATMRHEWRTDCATGDQLATCRPTDTVWRTRHASC